MKFERLKKDSRKKWLIGICTTLAIVGTIAFVGTRAKYKNTERIDLVDGTINWIPYDLNMVAIKLQNNSGEYTEANTIPTSGYKLNTTQSFCGLSNGDGTYTHEAVTMNYHDGVMAFDNMSKKGTKCFLYFDIELCGNACKTVLAGKTIDESRSSGNFTGAFEENTTGKIFKAEDNDGDTYFFAGAVDNNWVQFGGFYWRIIRINGDGTIRMIYSGVANGNVSDANKTGATTQVGTSEFNSNINDNAHVGYMYGLTGQNKDNGYANTHTNTNSSTIKTNVDTWYNANINKTGVKEHIDTNAGFCGDRTAAYGSGAGKGYTRYVGYERVINRKQAFSFKCTMSSNDLFTVSGANKGNKALTYPAGLITVDEMNYAGFSWSGGGHTAVYLYTNQDYWSMSPADYNGAYASVFYIFSSGELIYDYVNNAFGVRPVINLRADTQLTGDGTETNPYKVV